MLCAATAGASDSWPWQKDTVPEQVHIAVAGKDSTGMRVAWFTHDSVKSPSSVKFGLEPGALTQVVAGSEPPAQYLHGHGFHHVVEMLDLSPDTRYHYAVGSDGDGWSSEWSFKTAPSAESSISVSIFGDIGYLDSDQRPMELHGISGLSKKWSATVSRNRLEAIKDDLDMVWIVGDISYADDSFTHKLLSFTYEDTLNDFANWMENVSATRPLMVSPGNHESECHSPGCILHLKSDDLRNFSAYNARYHMPSEESTSQGGHNMWYSYNYGPAHFISVNTESDWHGAEEENEGDSHIIHTKILNHTFLPAGHFAPEGEYIRWLEADLKAASEARAAGTGPRWIIAGGHRPYGAAGSGHTDLFEKYGVDMYFAGHAHSYSRSEQVNGVTYVVVGGAGCEEMDGSYLWADDANGKEHVCVPQGAPGACDPGFAAPAGSEVFKTSRMAIGQLDVNTSALRWRLYDSADGEVLDEVVISSSKEMLV